MLKLIFAFVLLLALTQGQSVEDITKAASEQLPQSVRDVIEKSGQLEKLIALYQSALTAEASALGSGSALATLQTLVANAASKVATLTDSLATVQNEVQATLKDLASKLAESLGKTEGLSSLVSQFGDVHAAVQLECEDLKNVSVIALKSIKEIAVAKVQALLAEQKLYLTVDALKVVSDATYRDDLIKKVAALRATAKVADQLPALIQEFINNNTDAIEKCVAAAKDKAAALALGVKNAYAEVKQIVIADVQQFKDRVANIAQHVIDEKIATIKQILHVIDEVKQQVNVSFNFDIKTEISDEAIKQTIKAVLEAITLGHVNVTKIPGGKRQISADFIAEIKGAAELFGSSGSVPTSAELQAALTKLQSDPAVAAKISELSGLSSEQISALLTATLAELRLAEKASQDAIALWQQKIAEFQNKAAAAKETIKSAVSSEKDKLVAVFKAQQALIDAKEKELASQLNDLKSRIPDLTAELQQIQQQIITIAGQISANVNAETLAKLKAQKDALIEAAKAKVVELLAAKQNLEEAVKSKYEEAVKEIAALKAEVAGKLELAVQAELNATAAEIRARVAARSDEIKQRISEVVRAIQSDVTNITTILEQIPEGTKLVQSIVFDNTKTTIEDVIKALKSVVQAEFGTPKVTVSVKAGNKRSAQTATVETTVSSADGSSASGSSSPSGLPMGALIGIIVGAVVVVVIIVAVVAFSLKKKSDDDYQSMRA